MVNNDELKVKENRIKKRKMVVPMGAGVVLGLILGAVTGKIGIGLAIGIVIGGIGVAINRSRA
ncbi:MAG: hypothetical protein WCE64_16870 [Bacteroidales bacterium]